MSVMIPFDGDVETFAEVKRASGEKEFFKVIDGDHVPITEAEYLEATKEQA